MPDELTEKMHSEFTISREIEIKHKAGAIWRWYEDASEEEKEYQCRLMGITMEDALRWKDYWLKLKCGSE